MSIGFSGGGPHSLACAALLPGRCLAAASVAGVGPYGVEGLDFLAGMGPENVEEFTLADPAAPTRSTPFLEKEAAALGSIEGEQIIASLGGLISGADAGVINGEFADDLAAEPARRHQGGDRRLARRRPRVRRRLGVLAWTRSPRRSRSGRATRT